MLVCRHVVMIKVIEHEIVLDRKGALFGPTAVVIEV